MSTAAARELLPLGYYRPKEVVRLLRVHPNTVLNWIKTAGCED